MLRFLDSRFFFFVSSVSSLKFSKISFFGTFFTRDVVTGRGLSRSNSSRREQRVGVVSTRYVRVTLSKLKV